jgi:hypothetical protein
LPNSDANGVIHTSPGRDPPQRSEGRSTPWVTDTTYFFQANGLVHIATKSRELNAFALRTMV